MVLVVLEQPKREREVGLRVYRKVYPLTRMLKPDTRLSFHFKRKFFRCSGEPLHDEALSGLPGDASKLQRGTCAAGYVYCSLYL